MARPIQIVQSGNVQVSRTGQFADIASRALTQWAQQQEELKLADSLAAQVKALGAEDRVTALSKIASENPRVAQRIAVQIGTPTEDPLKTAQRDAALQAAGYRALPEKFDMAIHGRVGASMPAKAGLQPLPSDPAQAALIMSARNALAFNPQYAASGGIVDQVNRTRLTPEQQVASIAVDQKIQPTADTTLRETGQETRSVRTAETARRGQDVTASNAVLGATVTREGHGVTREGQAIRREEIAAGVDARNAQLKAAAEEIVRNNKQIQENGVAFAKSFNPDEKKAIQDQSRMLVDRNKQLSAKLTEIGRAHV